MSSVLNESNPVLNQAVNLTGLGPAVAVVQLVSKLSVDDNLLETALQIQRASVQGAQLIMLPESFAVFGDPQMVSHGAAAKPQQGMAYWRHYTLPAGYTRYK